MKVDTQAFPYPVLTNDGSSTADFTNSAFQTANLQLEIKGEKRQMLVLSYEFLLSNEAIRNLIELGDATYALEIRCSDTLFRQVHKVVQHGTVKFRADKVFGKVEITPMVVITKKVTGFSSDDLNEEFGESTFLLSPGDIIAIDSTFTHYIDFNQLKFESLVHVRTSEDIDPFVYHIVLDSELIYIDMGKKMREIWNGARRDRTARPYLAMSVYKDCVLMALATAFDDKESESRKWARALKSKLASLGCSWPENFDLNECNEIAQKITSPMSTEQIFKALKN